MFDYLNDDNFIMYAMKNYSSPKCISSEFEEDLKRIKYIKKLIKRYKVSGVLNERLILNHIIILGNVFGVEATVRMLFFKLEKESYPILKTFLLYLNYMPKLVKGIENTHLHSADITVDIFVGKRIKDNIGP